ncbi:hypothetical protein K435DRAFT_785113 [Dendrothele bispora CBS 962.96]|uniref:Uncharacterized protein n=1 Tax=Dendrothele bispora (strain CBS 962.96) TaxID=1314807 RepID=A0A4S8KZ68_DENBC|nr:hypothetical protein K435DRAFT_785113 [Dendrothele bispora CBS 962.96]
MDPPLKVMKRTESLPWAPVNPDDQSTGVQLQTLLVPTSAGVDEDDLSDDDSAGPMAKKARLDDDLESLVSKIGTTYYDKCEHHRGMSCFYHAPTKQHFDVGERRRALHNNPIPLVDLTRIPLGEGYFVACHAMKVAKPRQAVEGSANSSSVTSPSTPSTPTSATPVAASMTGAPGLLGIDQVSAIAQLTAAAQMQMMMSPMIAGYRHFMPATPQPMHSASSRSLHHPSHSGGEHMHVPMCSSSPFAPSDAMTLAEFCTLNNFSETVKSRLESLEFEPGDNLTGIPENVWTGAGFTQLSWDQVVKANKQYRKTHQ